jgi:membrane protease YdiL (CAAX protease family)
MARKYSSMAGDLPAQNVTKSPRKYNPTMISLSGRVETAPAIAVRRAALFVVMCSPLWLAPRAVWQGYPFTLAVLIGVTLLFLRWDRRSSAAIGLDWSWRRAGELVCGLVGGALLVAAIVGVMAPVLPFPWARNPLFEPRLAMLSFGSLLYGNSAEELIFRGYGFERLIAGIGHWQAQLVTAIMFAVFHIVNGWPWQVALIGTTTGSLLFGLVFVRWRSVPAAVGVHVAANWVRDLTLLDPPRPVTLFGPIAPRPWTAGEQLAAALVWDGLILVVCAVLWRSIDCRRVQPLESITAP